MERTEFGDSFAKKAAEDMQKMGTTVQDEKKQSEETEEALLEILKEMVSRIKNEIDVERKEREASEDTLLSLLEETCSKLNIAYKAA